MKRVTSAILAAIWLIGASVMTAQTIVPGVPLKLSTEVSRYRGGDEALTYVEVAYAFPKASLTYKKDSTGFRGALDLIVVAYLKDSVKHAERMMISHVIQDTADRSEGMELVGVYGLHLGDGDYLLRLIGRDANDLLRRDSVDLRLPIRKFTAGQVALSDVELASSIRRGKEGSNFYKNTLEVEPNVSGTYSPDQPLYFYAEAYNLLAAGDSSDYSLRASVFDAVGKEVVAHENRRKRVAAPTVLFGHFPVDSIRMGTYTLMLSLVDSNRTIMTRSGRKFFVYNPALGVDTSLLASATSLPMPQYMSMDEAELDREFDWCRYATMDDEKSQYSKFGKVKDAATETDGRAVLDAKRKFMSDFWRHREPGLREEYLARVSYANANFRQMTREGYRSDRGRVHIIYGIPDDIERHPNETETRPYEIWNYNNIQGGVYFVFVQKNTAGDYELVHSTHRNELHDENWNRAGITR